MRFATLLVASFAMTAADSIHEFTVKTIDGAQQPLAAYKGKVALIVNVASN